MEKTQRELDLVCHCMKTIVACGEEERAMYDDQHVNVYYKDALASLRVKEQGARERLDVLTQLDTCERILDKMATDVDIDNKLNNQACKFLGLKSGTSQNKVISGIKQRMSELKNK